MDTQHYRRLPARANNCFAVIDTSTGLDLEDETRSYFGATHAELTLLIQRLAFMEYGALPVDILNRPYRQTMSYNQVEVIGKTGKTEFLSASHPYIVGYQDQFSVPYFVEKANKVLAEVNLLDLDALMAQDTAEFHKAREQRWAAREAREAITICG